MSGTSEVPRHSRALYSPADEYPPPPTPRWSHNRRRSRSLSSNRKSRSRLSTAKRRISRLHRWARKRVGGMTLAQKIVTSLVLVTGIVTGILMLVFHKQILHSMLPIGQKLRSWRAGWLIVFLVCYAAAFPPMIGYSTSVTMAGFVYGFPNGWFIIAAGTIMGATSAFMACRYLFRGFAKRMVATDKRFAALSLTLKHDGIKLLCMIRLCPLPYSISNGAISTFPTVTPLAFAAATALATPKLMIHVWIGQRLAVLAAAEEAMDTKTKVLNYASIMGGVILGLGTGWIIYKRTIARAKVLEAEERARLHQSHHRVANRYDDDEDIEAGAAAGLISGLLEGDELDVAGMFTDLEEERSGGVYEDARDILLGDDTGTEEDGSDEAAELTLVEPDREQSDDDDNPPPPALL